MGLEAYVPVNPIAATTRTCILPATKHHFSYRKKHILPTCGGLKMTTPSPTTTTVAYSSAGRAHRPGIVCEAKTDEVVVVTDASWKNLVIGSQTPVLVEFWAPWCGPCRMIAPVIDELAKEYAGKIACFKLNTDDSPSIATEYGIRSIPTVLFFKNGEKKESVIGAVPKTTLVSTIDKYLDG